MMHLNCLLQLGAMICVHDQLSSSLSSHHLSQVLALIVFVFWTGWSLGLTYDEDGRAALVEFSR